MALLLTTFIAAAIPIVEAAQVTPPVRSRPEIFPSDAWELVASDRATLIDVRSSEERKQGSPRLVKATILYPMDGHGDDEFVRAVAMQIRDDRNAPLILICAAGPRSVAAQRVLEGRGYTNVRTVFNGFQGWSDMDMPREP
ncbi:MAG: rhodanese-like domain-containing protein [Casimicrobiaceae bacterium]